MANYIEWSKGLADKRETVIMAASLRIDRHEAAGRLMKFWEWCDENVPEEVIDKDTGDAVIVLSPNRGDTEKFIDQVACIKGFSKAMESVGWIVHKRSAIVLPNYGRHNGSTAKTRNRNTRNQAKRRVPTVTNLSPIDGDKNATNGTEHNVTKQKCTNERSSENNGNEKRGPWEFEIPFLSNVVTDHLKDDAAICFIHRNCTSQVPAAVSPDETGLTKMFACAVIGIRGKTNPLNLFKSLVSNPSSTTIVAEDMRRAESRLKKHRTYIRENPGIYESKFTPLCDEVPQ